MWEYRKKCDPKCVVFICFPGSSIHDAGGNSIFSDVPFFFHGPGCFLKYQSWSQRRVTYHGDSTRYREGSSERKLSRSHVQVPGPRHSPDSHQEGVQRFVCCGLGSWAGFSLRCPRAPVVNTSSRELFLNLC